MDAAVRLDLSHELASQDLYLGDCARVLDLCDEPIDSSETLEAGHVAQDRRLSRARDHTLGVRRVADERNPTSSRRVPPSCLSDGIVRPSRSRSRLLTITPPIPANKTYQGLIIRSPIVATPAERVNPLFRPRL
jgi:hypothetical protein